MLKIIKNRVFINVDLIIIYLLIFSFLLSFICDYSLGPLKIFGRKFSWGDPFLIVLSFINIILIFFSKRWLITFIGFLWIGYIFIFALSGYINGTILNGTFLNFFRSIVLFFPIYNTVFNMVESPKNKDNIIKLLLFSGLILCLFFLVVKKELIFIEDMHDYTKWTIFLNIIGLAFVTLYGIALLSLLSSIKIYKILIVLLLLFSISLCMSRLVYFLTLILTISFFFEVKIKKYFTIMIVIIGVIIVSFTTRSLFQNKDEIDTYKKKFDKNTIVDDFVQVRMNKINLSVFDDFFNTDNIIFFLIGKGDIDVDNISECHSFLPFSFVTTGFIGGIIVIGVYILKMIIVLILIIKSKVSGRYLVSYIPHPSKPKIDKFQ